MALTTLTASSLVSAPETVTSMSLDAPSPSMAMVRAILVMTVRRAASNSGSWSAGLLLDSPFARRMAVSLVDWSPSTLTMFMVSLRTDCQTSAKSGPRVASVVMSDRVVPWRTCIWGEIIPLPFEMAAT